LHAREQTFSGSKGKGALVASLALGERERERERERKKEREEMTRVAVKTKYESASQAASGTLTVGAGELKLKASCSDSTFLKGVSLHGVSLGIEKPGAFLIDYDLQHRVWCLSCFSTSSASTSSPTFCFHIGFTLYCDFPFSSWNLSGRHGVWLWYSSFGKLSTNLDVGNHFALYE
jgi:hypothetical protein